MVEAAIFLCGKGERGTKTSSYRLFKAKNNVTCPSQSKSTWSLEYSVEIIPMRQLPQQSSATRDCV